jgi:acetyltransferase EpsM
MSATPGLVVLGAGGHAKVVVAALLELGEPILTILDDDPSRQGGELLGVAVGGPIAGNPSAAGKPAALAIGDNSTRRQLSASLTCSWRTVVHPTAYVHPSVRLGDGTFVAAGAVIQPDALIGEHVIVNTGATVDHDCVVGSYSHLAPGAHLGGRVSVGEGALIGLGAGVAPGVSIGDWAILGAGAMAVRDLAARAVAVGVPARTRADG